MLKVVSALVLCLGGAASAGGLYLPGSGAVSTSRGGAAVASTEGGEAIGINASGLSRTKKGTTLTLSFVAIDFAMKFQRRGTYDDIPNVDLPYEGSPFPLVEDASKPALGIGGFQPIPVIAVTSDLGGLVPKLRVGGGIYAPNSYPFRDLCVRSGGRCAKYDIEGDASIAPNPARYDVVSRTAVLFMPTLAASYSVLPNLHIGARFGWGVASATSSVHIWTAPGNVVEDVGGDGLLTIDDAKDNFVPSYGLSFTFEATPSIEIAGTYNSEITIDGRGTASTVLGPRSGSGVEVMVVPVPDEFAQCAPGGRVGALKACIRAQLPRSAVLGGRYKFLGDDGNERGDIELNLGWENWGNSSSSDYEVVIDSEIVTAMGGGFGIKKNIVRHGFQDVFNARLGGSWRFPVGANTLIARGGAAYDSAAAKTGWQRADLDGAARTTLTAGAGFRTGRFQFDAGFGVVLQGAINNPGTCNPISPEPSMLGCNRDGVQAPLDERQGPDSINPLVVPEQQLQSPVNQGVFEQRYLMFMLGMTARL